MNFEFLRRYESLLFTNVYSHSYIRAHSFHTQNMINRQQFLECVLSECNISKHLFSKIQADAYDFRPTENQRSTSELLRYLAVCGSASMHVMLNNSDWKTWKPYTERISEMKPEDFPAAMDAQMAEITRMINSVAEEDFTAKEAKNPMGETMTLGLGLIRMTLGWLTAYRMQLFLYAKQSGAPEIGTSNNWAGTDRQKK